MEIPIGRTESNKVEDERIHSSRSTFSYILIPRLDLIVSRYKLFKRLSIESDRYERWNIVIWETPTSDKFYEPIVKIVIYWEKRSKWISSSDATRWSAGFRWYLERACVEPCNQVSFYVY